MGDGINRRIVLALVAAGVLGACSRPSATVQFTVEPRALDAVREAVRSFAISHRYAPVQVIGSDPSGLYYSSWLSRFEFYAEPDLAPGTYAATFIDNRAFPQDDIYRRLSDFIVAIRQIDGVIVPEGYE